MYKKIGIVIADGEEYRPFAESQKSAQPYNECFGMPGISFKVGDIRAYAVFCGMGKVNAATAAAYLAAIGCEAILNFGLSGGVHGVRRGDFNLPERFLEHDFDLTGIGYKPCEKPGQDYIYEADKALSRVFLKVLGDTPRGTAVCGDSFICDGKVSDYLYNTFGASTCDMETAAIASVCHAAKLPFIALRRISDDASDSAGDDYREINNNEGHLLSKVFCDCLSALCFESGEESL